MDRNDWISSPERRASECVCQGEQRPGHRVLLLVSATHAGADRHARCHESAAARPLHSFYRRKLAVAGVSADGPTSWFILPAFHVFGSGILALIADLLLARE
jgi:hypothetical protein